MSSLVLYCFGYNALDTESKLYLRCPPLPIVGRSKFAFTLPPNVDSSLSGEPVRTTTDWRTPGRPSSHLLSSLALFSFALLHFYTLHFTPGRAHFLSVHPIGLPSALTCPYWKAQDGNRSRGEELWRVERLACLLQPGLICKNPPQPFSRYFATQCTMDLYSCTEHFGSSGAVFFLVCCCWYLDCFFLYRSCLQLCWLTSVLSTFHNEAAYVEKP